MSPWRSGSRIKTRGEQGGNKGIYAAAATTTTIVATTALRKLVLPRAVIRLSSGYTYKIHLKLKSKLALEYKYKSLLSNNRNWCAPYDLADLFDDAVLGKAQNTKDKASLKPPVSQCI